MSKERLDTKTLINAIEAQKIGVETALEKVTVQFLEELKQYRDLEEQGLLLRLPCKGGSEVYAIMEIRDCSVDNCRTEISCEECEFYDRSYLIYQKNFSIDRDLKEIGRTLFLTKAEAEEKLRELEGKQNEHI